MCLDTWSDRFFVFVLMMVWRVFVLTMIWRVKGLFSIKVTVARKRPLSQNVGVKESRNPYALLCECSRVGTKEC